MIFRKTRLEGAFLIELEKFTDKRGFFARSMCRKEFETHGLSFQFTQCSIAFNKKKGTLRGMHYQAYPKEEDKLIRCNVGAIFDVIVDIRKGSDTYGEYISCILSGKNGRMVYVPKGFAHGYITLEDNTEVFYQMTEFYAPEYSMGFKWNDPFFGIKWPLPVQVISDRDLNFPDFRVD